MFTKTVIKQGNKIIEQDNLIKKLKEENAGLRDELEFRKLDKDRLIRNINKIIENGNVNKEPYFLIVEKIKNELVDDKSH